MNNLSPHEIIILGGGISGLATAWYLHNAEIPFRLFEKNPETGGKISSTELQGNVIDFGPNSLRDREGKIRGLADQLGLSDDIIQISEAFKTRFIVRDGKLESLSPSLGSLLSTNILSPKGKLRALAELFVSRGPEGDESIGAFLERRIGKEAVDYLVDPVFSGIYAGDIYQMSKETLLPKLAEYEQSFGSITWGGIRSEKQKKNVKPVVLSFRHGIQQLTDAITDRLSEHIINEEVTGLDRGDSGFKVITGKEEFEANHVISCIPAYRIGRLLKNLNPDISILLESIDYAPMLSTQLLFDKNKISSKKKGFGFLVPRKENVRLLGAIWKSSIFPELSQSGQEQFTLMTGGAHDPIILSEPQEQIERKVVEEFLTLMEFDGAPSEVRSRLWPKAIPQFEVGYEQKKEKLSQFEIENPGLHIGGNFRWGVSVPDCIQGAESLVNDLSTRL